MYKRVLYNIKKMKKCGVGGRGRGQYLNQKHSLLVRRITGIILVNLDLRCIENVLTDYDSQHL